MRWLRRKKAARHPRARLPQHGQRIFLAPRGVTSPLRGSSHSDRLRHLIAQPPAPPVQQQQQRCGAGASRQLRCWRLPNPAPRPGCASSPAPQRPGPCSSALWAAGRPGFTLRTRWAAWSAAPRRPAGRLPLPAIQSPCCGPGLRACRASSRQPSHRLSPTIPLLPPAAASTCAAPAAAAEEVWRSSASGPGGEPAGAGARTACPATRPTASQPLALQPPP